ncbi:MAG: MATE family efflux transporter [Clostridia bacterium]
MSQKNTLLTGNINRVYTAYLIPTLLAMVSASIYVIADVLFVATYLGENSLAAFNICMPIYTCYSAVSLLFGVGASTTISICAGRGDLESANKVFSLSLLLVLIISVLSSLLGIVFITPFAYALGSTKEILPLVIEYILPVHSMSTFYMLSMFFQVIIRADYNPKLVMGASIVGNLVNIGLDYLFMVELRMGLRGASIATGIGPIITFMLLMTHYIFKKNNIKLRKIRFERDILMSIIKNGSGSCILEFTSGTVIFLFNFALLRVSGSDAVAIYAIVSNIAFIGKCLFSGIAQAAQPLISVNYGAQSFIRMKKSTSLSIRVSIFVAIFSYIMIILFPETIMSIFIGQYEHLISRAGRILIIYFASFVFTGMNTSIMYYFQSTGNAKISSLMSVSRGFLLIIIGLLMFSTTLGEIGVWITITFAEVLTFLVAYPLKRRYDTYLVERYNPVNDMTFTMNAD